MESGVKIQRRRCAEEAGICPGSLWLFPLWALLQIIIFLSAEPQDHPKESMSMGHLARAPDFAGSGA